MIPAHTQNPAPVPAGPNPRPAPAPRAIPADPPQTRPKANDPGTPYPSATPKRFRSSASWART